MSGELRVLNVSAGDIEIRFDKDDPVETARAERVIGDMLSRGYIIFLRDAKEKLHKVKKFDPKTSSYIIADGPLYAGDLEPTVDDSARPARARGGGRSVPMKKARAIGIAPSAGG